MPTHNGSGQPTFCVLGAGHGGTAMAAHLSLMGFEVRLFNRSEDRLRPIRARGGIELLAGTESGLPAGQAPISVVTTDPAEALDGAEVLMVVVPATGHRTIAELCAPHLRDGQMIVLNPGRTGGALEFHQVLRAHGVSAQVLVGEAQTFLYASRAVNPGQLRIFRIKNAVPVAAIPAYRTVQLVQTLRVAFPQFVPGDNVMKTSMDNIGAVFHPAIMMLNAGRIEQTNGNFEFYLEGVTPSVARVLEAIDRERVAVAEAMGFRCLSAREWLYVAYDAAGRNLYEAMRANPGYRGIQAPPTINHRYLNEDVPMSLVPIASLGSLFGVPTPSMQSVITMAQQATGVDYCAEGRTVERLGLEGLTLRQVRELVLQGHLQTPAIPRPTGTQRRFHPMPMGALALKVAS